MPQQTIDFNIIKNYNIEEPILYTGFNKVGNLSVETGQIKQFPPDDIMILQAKAYVSIPAQGNNIIINIIKNNNDSILTSQLNIESDLYFSNIYNINEILLNSDYLTVNINQVGSIQTGSDLVVRIAYKINK